MKNSLIGYFKLNSNARDYSGFNRNGTATGVVYKKNLFGKDCAEFNSVNSKIDTGSDWLPTGDLTVSAWINPNGIAPAGRIIENGNFFVYYFVTQKKIGIRSNNVDNLVVSDINSVELNQWQHVLVTRDSDGIVKIYINGVDKTVTNNSGTPVAGTTNVIIGNRNDGDRAWGGLISELKVYNKVLSFDEIQKDYRSTLPEFFGKNSLKNIVPDLNDSSLVGAWLNAGTVEAEDYSNHNNDGVANDLVFEKVGGKFNGSSSYVYLGDSSSSFFPPDNYTISVWINKNPAYAGGYILAVRGNSHINMSGFGAYISSNKMNFTTYGSKDYGVGVNSLNSGWNHCVWVYNHSDFSVKYYLNGVLDKTISSGLGMLQSDNGVFIGVLSSSDDTIKSVYWAGEIKDLRVYNEVKSGDFVKNLFVSSCPEPDLVFSCFDGLKDLSKYERNLINTNTLVGKEMVFNGTDSKISVVSNAGLDLSSNFTISCWVNLNSNLNHTLIGKGEGSTSQYVLDIFAVGKIRFFGYQDTTAKGVTSQGGVSVNDNKWHHIVGTFDGTYWITYVDGIVNYTVPSIATLNTTFDNLSIGKRGNNIASGVIKDVKVYNSVKSLDWVKKEYEVNKKFY